MPTPGFNDLKDKVCVITGGAGIIAKSLATALGNCGTKIVLLDLNKDKALESAKEIQDITGAPCYGFEANVLDENALREVKGVINSDIGKVDFLINCAGGNSPKATTQEEFLSEDLKKDLKKTFFGLEVEGFQHVFNLNFMGTLLPSMVFGDDMIESGKGSILNISSMAAFTPLTKVPAYSAAKASINNFTMWLSTHFAKVNIRVNAVAPGFFLTDQNRFLLTEENGELTARGRKIIEGTPMGKFGETDEISGAALYLLSDLSTFVTGVIIPVDGGYNAYSGV